MPQKKIASFSVSSLQILDDKGTVDSKLEPSLSDEQLLRAYRAMKLGRESDQRMLKLQRQGRLGTFGPGTGQEAAVCGPALAMGEKDWMVGAFREPTARLMRGESVIQSLQYWNGFEEGNSLDPATRTTPIAVIVASQAPHAVGLAYAMQYRGEKDSAVVCFVGDGGTSEGDFHEALNFASVWRSPVVFVIQNNLWAISTPTKKQAYSKTLAQRAIAYDMPGIQVDGNDVLAMYQASKDALDRAHAGEGPTLIEAMTYRLMMHTTADDPKKYRTEEEEQEWWKKDPLIRFRSYLTEKGILDEEKENAFEVEIREHIDEQVKAFEEIDDYKPDAPFDHIFGTEHSYIERQRDEFLANLKRGDSDG